MLRANSRATMSAGEQVLADSFIRAAEESV